MNDAFAYIALGLIGAALGSFVGAQVWRLRARELADLKAAHQKIDKQEFKRLKPLLETKKTRDRSRCLNCSHQLVWYDLIPLVSWLSLGGRCRYCREFIGWYEPLVELGVAAVFMLSYAFWPLGFSNPLEVVSFGVWLVAVVLLAILFIYDLKWFILPDRIVWPFTLVAAALAVTRLAASDFSLAAIGSVGLAIFILSGIYYLLYRFSSGRLIGFGDIKLGIGLALILIDWRLAFLCLFVANLLGLVIILPGLISGKLTRASRVPFGPFLMAGLLVSFWFGGGLIDWYFGLFLSA